MLKRIKIYLFILQFAQIKLIFLFISFFHVPYVHKQIHVHNIFIFIKNI